MHRPCSSALSGRSLHHDHVRGTACCCVVSTHIRIHNNPIHNNPIQKRVLYHMCHPEFPNAARIMMTTTTPIATTLVVTVPVIMNHHVKRYRIQDAVRLWSAWEAIPLSPLYQQCHDDCSRLISSPAPLDDALAHYRHHATRPANQNRPKQEEKRKRAMGCQTNGSETFADTALECW